jgi:hypothetical protein
MNDQTKDELEIIGGGLAWFAVLLAGFTLIAIIGGGVYLACLGKKIYG